MPSYLSGKFIKGIRKRKQLKQEYLLYRGESSEGTISRIENGRQVPKSDTLETFMSILGFDKDDYFCPFLENQTLETLFIRQKIFEALESENVEAAKNLLAGLEKNDMFKKNVNLQFALSCKIKIALLENLAGEQLIETALLAIRITFPEFNEDTFKYEVLIFEEPFLIYALAMLYHLSGELAKATRILESLQKSIEYSPVDNYIKEKILPQIILNKAQILIEEKNFERAVLLYENGIEVSLKWNNGKDVPGLLYQKALCLMKLGRNTEYPEILKQAYACYVLLGKRGKSEEVLENARAIFQVEIEPLKSEIDLTDLWKEPFYAESELSVKCGNVGELLNKLRHIAGIKQRVVYAGICSPANYSKIENGKVEPNFFALEAFMQRLGRDINQYLDTFLSSQDFYWKQKKRDIHAYLSMNRAIEAENLVRELEADKKNNSNIDLQFILSTKSEIMRIRHGYSEKYLMLIQEALKKTIANFNEEEIDSYRLTYEEILLINKLACAVSELGDIRRAVKIHQRMKTCMDRTYVHDVEKARTYGMILYNYSKELGLEERYREALEIIEIGERLCVKHQKLNILPRFAFNKACDLLELGQSEQSILYFKLSYYGFMGINMMEASERVKAYVKEKLNIDLEY